MTILLNRYQRATSVSLLTWIKAGIILALLTLTAGCGLNLPSSSSSSSAAVAFDANRSSAYYLGLMQTASGSQKIDYQLMAIRALLAENRLSDAAAQLNSVGITLNREQAKEKRLSQAELTVREKRAIDLDTFTVSDLSSAQLFRYYQIRILQGQAERNLSRLARDYIKLETLATPSQKNGVINQTWGFFAGLSPAELQSLPVSSSDQVMQGWIQLSYLYQTSLTAAPQEMVNEDGSTSLITPTLSDQERKQRIDNLVADWRMQYPTHPAAMNLPRALGGSGAASTAVSGAGKRVALFLPLQGSSKVFGDVLRSGYMDAMRYFSREGQQNVTVFDTTSAPIEELVNQAKQQGAELIVGPLLKNDVVSMLQLNHAIPVLALNRVNGNEARVASNLAAKVCYFSLSPEDEASDAAKHILSEGKRTPLIITSQNNVGRRVAAAFGQSWSTLSGSPAYVNYFASLADLKASMNRGAGMAVQGELLTAGSSSGMLLSSDDTQSVPSAGAIDAIYIFASQDELSFIKPMLDMKATGSLPTLYTSSRSQTATVSSDYRLEMDRVQFSDIPLLVGDNPVFAEMPSHIRQDYSLARLYAMGIDAWRLANRFNELNSHNPLVLDGLTGKLGVETNCQINRSLVWGIYRQGKSELLSQGLSN